MSKKKSDRFERVEKAINQVREELDAVIDESKEAGEEVGADVREAIDDVEARIEKLRSRTEEQPPDQ